MTIPQRIVVGVDGSDDSMRALGWAADLVSGSTGEIIAVHALGLLAHLDAAAVVPSAGLRDEIAERLAKEWCRSLTDVQVLHRSLVVDGDPVTAVLATARDLCADLVVVGSRGTGGHPGLMLGSTSRQLVQQADRPVVVVPRGPVNP